MTFPDPAAPRPRVHVLTLRPGGAREDTARRVGAVLAEAFATDPYTLGLVPEDRREARLERKFTAAVRHGLRAGADGAPLGAVDVAVDADDGTLLGAAVWTSPATPRGVDVPGLVAGLPAAVAVHGRHTLALKRIQAACERARPAGRHWYLEEVGTVPSARGRGAASALVRHGQRRASGLPVHLEASVPATVPFYERLGFRATGHVPVPGGEPLTCLRWEA